jgi:hypothetical protein
MKRGMMMRPAIALTIFAIASFAAMPAAHAGGRHGGHDHDRRCRGSDCVVASDQDFEGQSYAEWQARWYQWFASIPTADSPLFDDTGARCMTGQTGDVWFSAPVSHAGTTERTCTLPEGTSVFYLVQQNECSTLEQPPFFGANEADLRTCAADGYETAFSTAVNTLRIDGREVDGLDGFRVQTPLYNVTFPTDNVAGATPGTGESISDGIFVMIPHLSVGTHRIELHGDIASGPLAGTIDENYTIIVTPHGNGHDCGGRGESGREHGKGRHHH